MNTTSPQIGADAFVRLLADIKKISDATVRTAGGDGRDYRAMTQLVRKSLTQHVLDGTADDAQNGFLRALTDLLCMTVDGAAPDDQWNPLKNTAAAFADGHGAVAPYAPAGDAPKRVTAARANLAHSALYEITEVSIALRKLIAERDTQGELMFVARGMLARIQALAEAADDVVHDFAEPLDDAELARIVTCGAKDRLVGADHV